MIITILICLIVIGYLKFDRNTNYSPLSQDEIGKFIKKNNIAPLSVVEVKDTSMILYENGIYELSNYDGKIIQNHTEWGSTRQEKVQIGMSSMGSPYVSVIIDDKNLLKEANEVKIIFEDGKTVTKLFKGKRGMFVFYNKVKSNLAIEDQFEILIKNKEGIVIYKNTL